MVKSKRPTGSDYPPRKDADGKPLCRYCSGPVKPPRRTMCSQPCVHEMLLRTSSSYLRAQVLKRDKGICAACGCDTELLARILHHARHSCAAGLPHIFERKAAHVLAALDWSESRSYWEADHIVEVVRGGDFDLSNVQTLCVPCHKAKTKRLAQERAQERRAAKRQSRPGPLFASALSGDNDRTAECAVSSLT